MLWHELFVSTQHCIAQNLSRIITVILILHKWLNEGSRQLNIVESWASCTHYIYINIYMMDGCRCISYLLLLLLCAKINKYDPIRKHCSHITSQCKQYKFIYIYISHSSYCFGSDVSIKFIMYLYLCIFHHYFHFYHRGMHSLLLNIA